MLAGSETSQLVDSARRFKAVTARAVSSAPCSRVEVTTTSAPARARERAAARPIPREAPVTSATFPANPVLMAWLPAWPTARSAALDFGANVLRMPRRGFAPKVGDGLAAEGTPASRRECTRSLGSPVAPPGHWRPRLPIRRGSISGQGRLAPSVLAVADAVFGGFPKAKLLEAVDFGFEPFPQPNNHIFGGWVFHEVIEILVVAFDQGGLPNFFSDLFEVPNHSVPRVGLAHQAHAKLVVVTVQAGARSVVKRQPVGGTKGKVDGKFHSHPRATLILVSRPSPGRVAVDWAPRVRGRG